MCNLDVTFSCFIPGPAVKSASVRKMPDPVKTAGAMHFHARLAAEMDALHPALQHLLRALHFGPDDLQLLLECNNTELYAREQVKRHMERYRHVNIRYFYNHLADEGPDFLVSRNEIARGGLSPAMFEEAARQLYEEWLASALNFSEIVG